MAANRAKYGRQEGYQTCMFGYISSSIFLIAVAGKCQLKEQALGDIYQLIEAWSYLDTSKITTRYPK
jgi:hypothetical protein